MTSLLNEKPVTEIRWPITGEKEFRVLACGDRHWGMIKPVQRQIEAAFDYCTMMQYKMRLIHGAAPGADEIAGFMGQRYKVEVTPHPAEWSTYGHKAGMIRNKVMLHERPHIVLAFHNNLAASKGTADMVQIALADKRPVFRIAADCRVWELSFVQTDR